MGRGRKNDMREAERRLMGSSQKSQSPYIKRFMMGGPSGRIEGESTPRPIGPTLPPSGLPRGRTEAPTGSDRNILEKVSFKIETGETALIVGPTGIGKSTIAKLLLRLYDPDEGQILIKGVNIKQLSLESLYETVSWVPQEGYLLNDTIKANIQFVRPEATLAEIEEALANAHLLNFIKKLPQGINTIVGDRGLKLSGGEKQRLSLARLFLKKPKICIFDESTSSLDKNTDFIIQNNIEEFLSGATKIIITHRPYLARKVDQVITINNRTIEKATNLFLRTP